MIPTQKDILRIILNHTRRCGLPREILHSLLVLEEKAMKMTELGEAFGVTNGAVTGIADRLEAAGLIKRKTDPEDRRGYLLEITPQGEKVLNHLMTGKAVHIEFSKGRRPSAIVTFPGENPENPAENKVEALTA
jgi:DNA-binding MarR family transcriptional regulator